MQSNFTKKLLILFVAILFVGKANAQDDIDKFLESGIEDANTLIEGYVEPFMKGFGTALGNGWTNTAKPHKSLGFDLTITVNSAHIPDDQLFYTPELLNGQYATGSPQPSPTIFGPNDDNSQPTYTYTYQETVAGQDVTYTGNIDGPKGLDPKGEIGMQAVPVPMVNLGIGIYKNTDLRIRWTPKIDIGSDGEFKVFGLAAMHDIKQHIPGLKFAPFDLSVLVGFTDISLKYSIAEEAINQNPGDVYTPDGEVVYDVNTWTFQGLASKKFSVLTLYGGIGYNVSKSSTGLKGTYIISESSGNVPDRTYIDPIDLSFKQNGPRVTAGMRLKLGPVTLHGDYTVQKYNTLTVGFGFSFR